MNHIFNRAGRAEGADGAIAPPIFRDLEYFPRNIKIRVVLCPLLPQYLHRPLNNLENAPTLFNILEVKWWLNAIQVDL